MSKALFPYIKWAFQHSLTMSKALLRHLATRKALLHYLATSKSFYKIPHIEQCALTLPGNKWKLLKSPSQRASYSYITWQQVKAFKKSLTTSKLPLHYLATRKALLHYLAASSSFLKILTTSKLLLHYLATRKALLHYLATSKSV
jgi:hypothetical protein